VDPVTRNAFVRARVPNASGVVSPGSSVRVVVPVGRELDAVVVPATAVRKGPGGDHVFVIAADPTGQTRAHMRPVRSGAMVGPDVVILEGLEAGEVIAAQGSFKLFESIAVNVAQADADASVGLGGSR
jgi:membrane fusion protein (multidrug efflux system)